MKSVDVFGLNKQVKNEEIMKLIHNQLTQCKNGSLPSGQDSSIYYTYLKRLGNMKKNEEAALVSQHSGLTFDKKVNIAFKQKYKNCLHVKSSYFIWRAQK